MSGWGIILTLSRDLPKLPSFISEPLSRSNSYSEREIRIGDKVEHKKTNKIGTVKYIGNFLIDIVSV